MSIPSFLFQLFSIHMHIPILTGIKKWMHNLLKKWLFCDKNTLLNINFLNEGNLGVNFLIDILTIYCRCLVFQCLYFLRCGMHMFIPVLEEVQN